MNEANTGIRGLMSGGALADDVTAAEAAHHSGVRHAGRNVAAITRAVEMRFAVYGEGHFAAENDVGGFGSVNMIGILRIWSIGPKVGVRKTFAVKLGCKSSFVQHVIQAFREFGLSKTATPSYCPQLAVRDKEGALSSSGEKIVKNPEQEAHPPEEQPSGDASFLSSLCVGRLLSR
jgi:hypothetical protein